MTFEKTPGWLDWYAGPSKPRFQLPAGAVDAHCHVFGSGEQRRCFGYVGDVVEALVRLPSCPGVAGEVINIGNDEETTINELARLVRDTTGSDSEIVHVSYEQAYGPGFEDMTRRVPSLQKIERLLGCRPRTSLATIVRRVADHERVKFAEPRYEVAGVAAGVGRPPT